MPILDPSQTRYQVRATHNPDGAQTTVFMSFEDGSCGPLTDTVCDDVVAAVQSVLNIDGQTQIVASRADVVTTYYQ